MQHGAKTGLICSPNRFIISMSPKLGNSTAEVLHVSISKKYINTSDLVISRYASTACTVHLDQKVANAVEIPIEKTLLVFVNKLIQIPIQNNDRPCLLCHLCYLVIPRIHRIIAMIL